MKHSISSDTALKWLVTLLAALAIAVFLAGVAPPGPPLAFSPMLGSIGGFRAFATAAGVITLGLCVGLIALLGLPRERLLCLPLTAALWLSIHILAIGIPDLLSRMTPATTTVLTVAISSVEGDGDLPNGEQPDCLWAYHFSNSVGDDMFVCTDSTTPAKAGSMARVAERRNFFGISITEFSPANRQ
ncbi:hypothetical protein [Burkholderia ubonensis]|uniref:hypothetical protein n=1 Tax=Burkholderia ubonensis TaxID=101571 RepID=UPI00075EFCB1|nr:hypothetical protein [Burkholderia ubonensis]KVP17289.1 hypothetical protein WJ84_03400 [Burkholderia ubonensis]KVP39591.1 hypothetical protein WJ87_04970 [Burkholderia ubonensis]